jgi:hypothetical protein
MNPPRYAKLFFVLTVALALPCVSCDGDIKGDGENNYKYSLHGTWERTEAAFRPEGQNTTGEKGRIVLTYNTITISGPIAHLQGFTRNTALKAYTEDGKRYINDRGAWQSPITYTVGNPAVGPRTKC